MRLICPNCGAQYEVPSEVIPESGRDVQCSECGATWFQHHPDHMPEEGATLEATPEPEQHREIDQDVAEAIPDEYGAETEEEDLEPDSDVSLDADAEEDEDQADEDDVPASAEPEEEQTPQRRELDENIAGILREEAERETQAREQDAQSGLETQEELGLENGDPAAQKRSEEARSRMATLRGEPDSEESVDEMDIDPSSRRNLLPDIDEINSSLSDSADGGGSPAAAVAAEVNAAKNKSGFKTGFRIAVILAVLALLLYVFAPQIANSVPALEGVLSSYVDGINSVRAGLNTLIEGVVPTSDDTAASE